MWTSLVNHVGDDSLKTTTTVMEGGFDFQPLKDILISLKNEVDRCLGRLEMGLDLVVAGNIEGPAKGHSKCLEEKASGVSIEGEGNINMGHWVIGPNKLSEISSSYS